MKQTRLPEELSRFIAGHIDSVHTLEVLLLLHEKRDQAWTASDVLGSVKSSLGAIQNSLDQLVVQGLVRQTSENPAAYQYSPKNAGVVQLIAELSTAYAERRSTVIQSIYSRPIRVAQTFSDAFDLRKKLEP